MDSRGIPEGFPVEFTERVVYLSGRFEAYRPHLGGVVLLDGRLDESRLRRAMRLLLDAEPVLGCRFVPDSTPAGWRRLAGLDEAELMLVRDSEDPEADAAAFVAEAFDCTSGPQVLGMLLHGPSSDTLAVKVSHVVMDGGALKETLYLIGDIYRAIGERPDWRPEPNVDGVRRPIVHAGLFERVLALRQNDVMMRPSDWKMPMTEERGEATYVSAGIEPRVFRLGANLAKEAGATVNDLILTAYYRTLFRLLHVAQGSRTPLMISCELRKHLPPGTKTALSNISGAWFVSVPPEEGEGFDGTLSRVREATREWKRSGAGKASAIGMPLIDKLTRKKDMDSLFKMLFGKPKDIGQQIGGLTNIGIIAEDRLDFGSGAPIADAYLLGPASCMAVALTTTTYRDRLHLSIGAEFAALGEEFVRKLVAGTAHEIEAWVAAREAAA